MGISLCSTLVVVAIVQGTAASPPPAPAGDTGALRIQRAPDSTDGRAQVALGRAYLQRFDAAHAGGAVRDTLWARRVLDTADEVLTRAALALGSPPPGASPTGDTARVLRVRVWSERALLAWHRGGLALGPNTWGPLPGDLRLSPVLEELGENLLRACPAGGALLTAADADSYAAWYMRFVRGLRPDLLVIPLAVWRRDSLFRVRAAADLRLGRRARAEGWLGALVERRPVCVSMALDRPPDAQGATWRTRPLVWVAGPQVTDDPVPPRDFGFAALKVAVDNHDPWAQPVLELYGRAARATARLCEAFSTFGVSGAIEACRH